MIYELTDPSKVKNLFEGWDANLQKAYEKGKELFN